MKKKSYYKLNDEPEVLSGFSRTLAEIEWLLLVLVLFYLVVGGVSDEIKPTLILASCLFALLVIVFQYLNFFHDAKEWKIAFQTWIMIFFVSWMIWYTGKLQSPLFNLFLLPVIASALTLGKLVTLLEVCLICMIFTYLNYDLHGEGAFSSLQASSDLLMLFFPMLLVAYISTMLAADIQVGFNKLKAISETDDLTKLFNRRSIKQLSEKLLKQAERHDWQVAVLMIDADNLKEINDRLGHEAGNLLLTNLAQCLMSVLRDADFAARYGGDEFVVLLADCDQENALIVADRIVDEFKQAQIRYQGVNIPLSASIGAACYPKHGHTIEVLLDKSDQAMYFSKRQGHNLVTLYREELSA
ncbi:MAG: GGDEF domain-containing protein [Methylovulum sp.]|nr:GGDEF domain-containing protein [Methylovulum sp.]